MIPTLTRASSSRARHRRSTRQSSSTWRCSTATSCGSPTAGPVAEPAARRWRRGWEWGRWVSSLQSRPWRTIRVARTVGTASQRRAMPIQYTPTDADVSREDWEAAVRYLLGRGARFVLCRDDKKPLWKKWQRRWPRLDEILDHWGPVGIVPASIGMSVLDADIIPNRACMSELLRRFAVVAVLRSKKAYRAHLWMRDTMPRTNGKFSCFGVRGDLRSGSGYAILWGEAAIQLAAAIEIDLKTPGGKLHMGQIEDWIFTQGGRLKTARNPIRRKRGRGLKRGNRNRLTAGGMPKAQPPGQRDGRRAQRHAVPHPAPLGLRPPAGQRVRRMARHGPGLRRAAEPGDTGAPAEGRGRAHRGQRGRLLLDPAGGGEAPGRGRGPGGTGPPGAEVGPGPAVGLGPHAGPPKALGAPRDRPEPLLRPPQEVPGREPRRHRPAAGPDLPPLHGGGAPPAAGRGRALLGSLAPAGGPEGSARGGGNARQDARQDAGRTGWTEP